jgi:hypothetical protein
MRRRILPGEAQEGPFRARPAGHWRKAPTAPSVIALVASLLARPDREATPCIIDGSESTQRAPKSAADSGGPLAVHPKGWSFWRNICYPGRGR